MYCKRESITGTQRERSSGFQYSFGNTRGLRISSEAPTDEKTNEMMLSKNMPYRYLQEGKEEKKRDANAKNSIQCENTVPWIDSYRTTVSLFFKQFDNQHPHSNQ